MTQHADLPDGGSTAHHIIDQQLPSDEEAHFLRRLSQNAPKKVSGARDDPEEALKSLLSVLQSLGIIDNSTSSS